MNESTCKLKIMFKKRLEFINEMKASIPGSYPDFPLDISQKASQQVCSQDSSISTETKENVCNGQAQGKGDQS